MMLTPQCCELLRGPNFAVITTINADGTPQQSVVWVAERDGNVVFSTVEGRAKHRNLVRDPRIGVLVLDRADGYRYSQIRGIARLEATSADALIDELSRKYTGKAWVEKQTRPRVNVIVTPAHQHTADSAPLHMAFTDHAVLLLPCWSDDDGRASEIGRRAVAALERRLGEHAAGLRVAAGIGDLQLAVDRANVSYRQARLAAKVAGVVSTGSTCPRWRDLGVFRTLAQLPSWDCDTDLDPRVQALFREADPDVLRSVETYLDLGCDVQRTSGELHLHRGTLYYRLDKAEKLSGLHLRDGNDRLSLHLGFKIARLAGRYPA